MSVEEQRTRERVGASHRYGSGRGGPSDRSGATPRLAIPIFVSLVLGGLVILAYATPSGIGAGPAGIRGSDSDRISASADPTEVPDSGRFAPRLVRDITAAPGEGSHPHTFAGMGGSLIFFADDRTVGVELWKSDGTEAGTVLLKDINPGRNGSLLGEEIGYAAGVLYFAAYDAAAGAELWRTDGTEPGTFRVKDINPGPNGSTPSNPANVGGVLYFAADDGASGRELWRTDGTEAGTMLVRDIEPGLNGSQPAHLTESNGVLYFVTNDGASLWTSDGTEAGTGPVKDINPSGTDSVFGLANVDGILYFSACDNVLGCELWKTDGTEAGTIMVKDIQVGRESGGAYVKRAVGGVLYFGADDGVTGTELWKTDGTEAGTVQVKDIYLGANHSTPVSLRNLNGVLYFTAVDGTTGRELWRSDGTEAGTVLVKDIYPGAEGSGNDPGEGPWGLTTVNGLVFFSACDDVSGCELWVTDGTEGGTAQVRDISPGAQKSGPSEHTNVNDLLYFTANDGTSGEELWMLDPTPPSLTVPPDGLSAEATEPAGAAVTYEVTARDNFDGPIVPVCSSASGATFPLGTTTVLCMAADSSGNLAAATFSVTIGDTTPATWTNSGDVVAEATGPNGAVVNYSVTARDAVDIAPIVDCTPPSGSMFPLGTMEVVCTARDAAGNDANLSLTVTVVDTTPATWTHPGNLIAEATGPTGAVVEYHVTAKDAVDPVPMVSCTPASGSTFPLGPTQIECTARDASGNEATPLSLTVTVLDTTKPTLQMPADVVRRAVESSGIAVTFDVTASDAVDSDPVVSCQPASGSSFPVGTTSVECTALDDAGNVATGSFRVVIGAPEGIAFLGVTFDPLLLVLLFAAAAVVLSGLLWRRRRQRPMAAPREDESEDELDDGFVTDYLTPDSSSDGQRRH